MLNYKKLFESILNYEYDNKNDNTKHWNFLQWTDVNLESINSIDIKEPFILILSNFIIEYYGSSLAGISYLIYIEDGFIIAMSNKNSTIIKSKDIDSLMNQLNNELKVEIENTSPDISEQFWIPNKEIPQLQATYNLKEHSWILSLQDKMFNNEETEVFSNIVISLTSELNAYSQNYSIQDLNYKNKIEINKIFEYYFSKYCLIDNELLETIPDIKSFNINFEQQGKQ
jgi:hypothetical protein